MELLEFVESYLKEYNLKLLPYQKEMLKAITEGKMVYMPGGRHGRSILNQALKAYEESRADET